MTKKSSAKKLTKTRREDIKYRINIKGELPESVANWYGISIATVLRIAAG